MEASYENPLVKTDEPFVPKYKWVEVSNEIKTACEALKLGELVHDDMFGLFEAMSAIEIMDPKMDAGMLCNRSKRVRQFKESLDEGILKVNNFEPEELLGITDQLWACFVTWLDGHSLVQTVFICLYTHDPSVIEDVVLKALCISILKMIDIIKGAVGRAKVFEEEDFQIMVYGFKLANNVTEMRVSGMLREAEEEISRRLKVMAGKENEGNNAQKIEHLKALKSRMKFLRAFYCALLAFDTPDCTEVQKAKEFVEAARRTTTEVISTLHLGKYYNESCEKGEDLVNLGFDPLVNQRLLPPSFPRQTIIFGRKQALEYTQKLMDRLQHICFVMDFTNFNMVLSFVSSFSRRDPCVLSRSFLQLIALQNGKVFGKLPLTDFLRETIKVFNSTPVLAEMSPLSTHTEAKELSNGFLLRSTRAMTSLLRAYGHNRARQRERLGELLEDLGNLQEEADKVDNDLNRIIQDVDPKRQHLACFGSWVLFHSLSVMMEYILLGFELELFNPHEYHYVYWYLDFLAGWGINCLSRAERLLNLQEQIVEKKSGKKDKRKKRELLSACSESLKEHQVSKMFYLGMKYLSLGLVKAYEGFDQDSKIRKPNSEFDNDQVRFEHRFLPFTFVDTPQAVLYKQYKEAVETVQCMDCKSELLFQEAMRHFERAVSTFQRMAEANEEIAKLLRIAKTNFVVMRLAASGHKKDSGNPPEWEFSSHTSFPIIKLM